MIRTYRDVDIDAVLAIWHAASIIAHPFLDDDFLARERTLIETEWMPKAEAFVWEDDDGHVQGFLAMHGNEVGAIFVAPDAQGRGIGRALMDEATRRHPTVELEVFEANHIGRRFYEACGFVETDRRRDAELGQTLLRLVLPRQRDPSLDPFVDLAIGDLAGRLDVDRSSIEVLSASLVTWPDPGFLGPETLRQRQVPVDGSEIVLRAGGRDYRYRTGGAVYTPTLFPEH